MRVVDEKRTAEDRDSEYTGWQPPDCCQDDVCDRKVHETYVYLAELKACICFKSSTRKMGIMFKVCSMHIERLFAQVKKATQAHLPAAERVCAAGLMCQWLRPHFQAGGRGPRVVTREQLIDDGVPIESNRVRSKRGGLQSSMQYSNEMLAAIKTQRSEQALPALTRIEIRALSKHCNTAFSSLSEDEQLNYKDMPKIENDCDPNVQRYDCDRRLPTLF